jgi:hypothetical protein
VCGSALATLYARSSLTAPADSSASTFARAMDGTLVTAGPGRRRTVAAVRILKDSSPKT